MYPLLMYKFLPDINCNCKIEAYTTLCTFTVLCFYSGKPDLFFSEIIR